MGRVKKGFNKGDIVICIETLSPIITEGKEYKVDWYVHKTSNMEPSICIREDRAGLSKVVKCKYFLPKNEYYYSKRNNKIDTVLN